MSKTTKALAILGVVAGLGVAALPFNAMAADLTELKNTAPADPVTDKVIVKTTIKDYIAIEINAGDEGTFDETDPTDATDTDKFHIHTLDLGDLTNNGDVVSGNLLVNVKTNNSKGYKLGIAAAGANLVGKDSDTHTIAGGVPTKGTSAWGFQAAAEDGDTTTQIVADYDGKYAAVPTTNTKIASYGAATDLEGINTKVTFGVSASASQAADEYSQTVTFTAATDATVDFAAAD